MTGEINVMHFAPGAPRRAAVGYERMENESLVEWEKLDEDQRAASVSLVRDVLIHALKTIDTWLPRSFVVENDHRLEVLLAIDLRDVNEEVLRRRLQAERELVETTSDLLAMQKELNDGTEPDEQTA